MNRLTQRFETPTPSRTLRRERAQSGRKRALARALFALPLLLVLAPACGGGGSSSDDPDLAGDYFPLAVGYSWTYEEDNASGLDVITKTIEKKEKYDGVSTFLHVTVQEKNDVRKTSNLYVKDGRTVRLRQQRFDEATGDLLDSDEYQPGFIRFDTKLAARGDAVQETHVRSEYDAGHVLLDQTTDSFTWLVQDVDVEKEVLGKTYTCLQVQRIDVDSGEVKRLYFARGIGKVLEELIDSGGGVVDSEALREYSFGD